MDRENMQMSVCQKVVDTVDMCDTIAAGDTVEEVDTLEEVDTVEEGDTVEGVDTVGEVDATNIDISGSDNESNFLLVPTSMKKCESSHFSQSSINRRTEE